MATLTLTQEGTNTVWLTATDAVGNVGTTACDVILDRTAPKAAIISPAAGYISGTNTIIVRGSVREDYGTPSIFANNQSAMVMGNEFMATLTLTQEGTNTVWLTATDAVGNVGTTACDVILDRTAPKAAIISPVSGYISGMKTIIVRGSVREDYGTPSILVNNQTAMVMGDEFMATLTLTQEGTNIVWLTATDAVGNVGTTACDVILDSTPPIPGTVSDGFGEDIGTTSSNSWLAGNFSEWKDDESGIMEYEYSIGSQPGWTDIVSWQKIGNKTYALATGLQLIGGKTYYFNIKGINQAQLYSISTSNGVIILDIDLKPPAQVNDGLAEDIDFLGTTTVYSGNWSRVDLQGRRFDYYYAVREGFNNFIIPWTCAGTQTQFSTPAILEQGKQYYLYVKVVDENNSSSDVTISDGVIVDITPPEVGVIMDGDYIATKTISLSWTPAREQESRLKEYYWRVSYPIGQQNDWISAGTNTSISLTVSKDERYYFELKAVNILGLESLTIKSDGVVVDCSPPSPLEFVNDGVSTDTDWINTSRYISANWPLAIDNESGIYGYWYSVGTARGISDIVGWQFTKDTSVTIVNPVNIQEGKQYYFNVYASNNAHLVSLATSSDGFRIDTSPPENIVVNDSGKWTTNSQELEFWWQGKDLVSGLAGYYVGLNPESLEYVGSRTHTRIKGNFTPGEKYYGWVKAVNNAGLYTIGQSDGIIIETTPPLGVTTPPISEYTYSSTPKMSFNWTQGSLTDIESGITGYEIELSDGRIFNLNNTTLECYGTRNYTYQAKVRAINGAGLTGQWSQEGNAVTIDMDCPQSKIMTIIDKYWQTQPLTITVAGSDSVGLKQISLYYSYSKDNEIYTAFNLYGNISGTNTIFTYPYKDGYYRFISQAEDMAGNKEPLKSLYELEIGYDTTPPDSYVLPIIPYYQEKGGFKLIYKATDNLSGPSEVQLYYNYSTDGKNWTEYMPYGSTTYFIPEKLGTDLLLGADLLPGYYQFYTQATDIAGNLETAPQGYDTGAMIKKNYPSSWILPLDKYWYNQTINIQVMGSDTIGLKEIGIYYRLVGNTTRQYYAQQEVSGTKVSTFFNLDIKDNGYYELSSQARDIAGKAENIMSKITLGVDTIPPIIQELSVPRILKGGETATLTYLVTDNLQFGTMNIFYWTAINKVVILDKAVSMGSYSWITPKDISTSTFRLIAQACDKAGNYTEKTISFILDTTPPVLNKAWEEGGGVIEGMDADADIDGDFVVRWDEGIDLESKILYYAVYESQDEKEFKLLGTTTTTIYPINHTDKRNYRYKIVAVNELGLSAEVFTDGIRIVDKMERINSNEVKITQIDERGRKIIIILPENAFGTSTGIMIIRALKEIQDNKKFGPEAEKGLILLNGSLREIIALNSKNIAIQPKQEIEIIIPYDDPDEFDEVADLSYRIYRLDNDEWNLSIGKQVINVRENNIQLLTNHLSIFGILAPSNLSRDRVIEGDVYPYPNPYKPSIHPQMKWWGIPETGRLKIWTISGELIYDTIVTPDTNNEYEFKEADQLPSGIYIFVVVDKYGGFVRGKFGVIR